MNCLRQLALAGLVLLPVAASSQSLWRDDSRSMFADKRAAAAGDIVTIVVQENTTASKDNKTSTSKQAAVDAALAAFLYSPTASGLLTKNGQLPALKFNSKTDFTGGGTINNSENIIARIAVRIVDILPNRQYVVEGKRETAFSGEKQTILLRGVIRADDITSGNTVFSYNVSDATIHILSKGTVTDSQRKGWFMRIWDKLSPCILHESWNRPSALESGGFRAISCHQNLSNPCG
jgi:flagellar L-ring protein precursor FlgH